MDVTATLASKTRRWSEGSIEEIRVVLTRTDGPLDSTDVTGVGFGTYSTEPSTFVTPLAAEQLSTSVVAVEILVGAAVRPEGRVYVWAQAERDDELVQRCCQNDRIDFTDADWANNPVPVQPDNFLYGSGLYGAGAYSPSA